MSEHHRVRARASLITVGLVLSACSADLDAGGSASQTLRYYATEPAFLFPGKVIDTAGSAVVDALFSPLIEYDDETGAPIPLVAAEVPTSPDGLIWTITIAEGWTFHNGEEVTARSFVDAWNWTAYGPNEAVNGYLFGPGVADVVGFADLQAGPDPDADGPQAAPRPGSNSMSGLRLVDQVTFTVTLTRRHSQFPLMLGTPAFYPLPSICLDDWVACNEAPVGNGPFRIDGAWEHDRRISVVAYDAYAGDPPNVGGVDFQIYDDPAAGADDLLAGRLDYLSGPPADLVPSMRAALGDRFVSEPMAGVKSLVLPSSNDMFGFGGATTDYGGAGGRNLRHALSMAIDRQGLIDALGQTAGAADSLVSPVVPGYRAGACGQWCVYDVSAARALYARSPGLDGPIHLWTEDDPTHQAWMDAVGQAWRDAFGLEYELHALDWVAYLEGLTDGTFNGPAWSGWTMDYPSAENYLTPLVGDVADPGRSDYADPEAVAVLDEARSAATVEAGLELYHRAEDLILEDMPRIPMFVGRVWRGHSERLDDVSVDRFGNLDLTEVTVSP